MNRKEYFDSVAHLWDEWNREEEMVGRIREGLVSFGIRPDEHVVDLGCGTGVLFGPLLELLSPRGHVECVDFSERMIEIARCRSSDPTLTFHVSAATSLPVDDCSVDRVICFSTWPHFPKPRAVLREVWRALRSGGRLHVWHLSGRETINSIHREAGGSIGEDLLCPAKELALTATRCGFEVEVVADESTTYLVTVFKQQPNSGEREHARS